MTLTPEDKRRLEDELIKIALRAVRHAKRLVRVDTGRLRASITAADSNGLLTAKRPEAATGDEVDPPRKPFTVRIGTNVEYGPKIEDLDPYLMPAARRAIAETKGASIS